MGVATELNFEHSLLLALVEDAEKPSDEPKALHASRVTDVSDVLIRIGSSARAIDVFPPLKRLAREFAKAG